MVYNFENLQFSNVVLSRLRISAAGKHLGNINQISTRLNLENVNMYHIIYQINVSMLAL